MKALKLVTLSLLAGFFLASCDKKNEKSNIDNSTDNEENGGNTGDSTGGNTSDNTESKGINIFLAGDSTVKTYKDEQFIGGWGQYLGQFTNEKIIIKNCAQGGRSSRSFINEGRLYDIEGCNYTFTENNGRSIEKDIKKGDYLFIQFGHNDDDTKKASSYSTMYDRMSPIGNVDSNGKYETKLGTKMPTTHLPQEYINNVSSTTTALKETAKYGQTYYAYDGGGTFKGYLKEYIDFARRNEAIPVLITPVSRTSFNEDGTQIIGKEGAHGPNLEYVEAVRQLAQEEDCLLIDLFTETKKMLETTTKTESDYLMALKPNSLEGSWPLDYDIIYKNTSLGYSGIEGTHYNKYGAFLTAAAVTQSIINNTQECQNGKEVFKIKDNLLKAPKEYVEPSNLMKKSTITKLENLFEDINVKNPNRIYEDPTKVVEEINKIALKGEITNENYNEIKQICEACRRLYNSLNIDDRLSVTNLNVLENAENKVKDLIEANRPKPTSTIVFNPSSLTTGTSTTDIPCGDFKIGASNSKNVEIKESKYNFSYNGNDYQIDKCVKLGGTLDSTGRYIEFTTTKACKITVVGASSSSASDRVIKMIDSTNNEVALFDALGTPSTTTKDVTAAGTYRIGSAGSGVYVYAIIIEYFA